MTYCLGIITGILNVVLSRVDNYREFIRSKDYALNNLQNFTEVIMKANKVIPENLIAVR